MINNKLTNEQIRALFWKEIELDIHQALIEVSKIN